MNEAQAERFVNVLNNLVELARDRGIFKSNIDTNFSPIQQQIITDKQISKICTSIRLLGFCIIVAAILMVSIK